MFPYTFRPFLTETKRELIHDFALPCAVLVMSFVGSFLFRGVDCKSIDAIVNTVA